MFYWPAFRHDWKACPERPSGEEVEWAPGHRKISISLPGYETFNNEFDLAPNQKFVLKTDLVKSNNPQMEESK